MTIGLYDTFANPQGCYIIREALYRTFHLAPAGCHLVCDLAKKMSLLLHAPTFVPLAAAPNENVEAGAADAANVLEVVEGEEPNENVEAAAEEAEVSF